MSTSQPVSPSVSHSVLIGGPCFASYLCSSFHFLLFKYSAICVPPDDMMDPAMNQLPTNLPTNQSTSTNDNKIPFIDLLPMQSKRISTCYNCRHRCKSSPDLASSSKGPLTMAMMMMLLLLVIRWPKQ